MSDTTLGLLAILESADAAMDLALESVCDIYVSSSTDGIEREANEAHRAYMLPAARTARSAFIKEMSEAIAYIHFEELKKSRPHGMWKP